MCLMEECHARLPLLGHTVCVTVVSNCQVKLCVSVFSVLVQARIKEEEVQLVSCGCSNCVTISRGWPIWL